MGRGSYLGGSTIIGPRCSSWFSKNKPNYSKVAKQRQHSSQKKKQKTIDEKLLDVSVYLAEGDQKRRLKSAQIKAARVKSPKMTPEERAKKVEYLISKQKKRRARAFIVNVEVYKKSGQRLDKVRIGVGNVVSDQDPEQAE